MVTQTHLLCIITTTDGDLFHGKVSKVTAETMSGEIVILPNHYAIVTVLQTGIVKVYPIDQSPTVGEFIPLSIEQGLLSVHNDQVRIVSSCASVSIDNNPDALQKLHDDLEKEIIQLQASGSIEKMEKVVGALEKVKADMRLVALQDGGL